MEDATLEAVETAVTRVVMWFVLDRLGGKFPLPEDPPVPAEPPPVELAEWRELYWWTMRAGTPKLLEKAALDAAQKRRQLSAAAVEGVRKAYKRDDVSLRDAIAEALDDGGLEEHWLDALEELRVIGCISAREEPLSRSSSSQLTAWAAATASSKPVVQRATKSRSTPPCSSSARSTPCRKAWSPPVWTANQSSAKRVPKSADSGTEGTQ